MKGSIERAYKQKCFQGRGMAARWLDRVFFSALGAISLLICTGKLFLSTLLFAAAMGMLTLWDLRRWRTYRLQVWRNAADELRRESWLKQEAMTIGQTGGTILYPTPDADTLIGHCLRQGQGASFHCFGEPQNDLIAAAAAWGCVLSFHPWGRGEEPNRNEVNERIIRDAPKGRPKLWRRLLQLSGNRYILAGCLLLLLSMGLGKALYWRLLGSLCLMIGALRRAFRQ